MNRLALYPLKVWLTSVVVSSIAIGIIMCSAGEEHIKMTDITEAVFMVLLLSLGLSIPSWLLLWLSTWALDKTVAKTWVIKLILSLISYALAVLPFAFLFGGIWNVNMLLPLIDWRMIYPLTIIAGIWIYNLPRTEENVTP